MTGGSLSSLSLQRLGNGGSYLTFETTVRSRAAEKEVCQAAFHDHRASSSSFLKSAFGSFDWHIRTQSRKQGHGYRMQELRFQTVATLALDRQAGAEGHENPQKAMKQSVRKRTRPRQGPKTAQAVMVVESRPVGERNGSMADLAGLASVVPAECVLEVEANPPSQSSPALSSDLPPDEPLGCSDRSPGLASTSGSVLSWQSTGRESISRRLMSRQRGPIEEVGGSEGKLDSVTGERVGRSKPNGKGSLADGVKWKARGRAAMNTQEMQPEDLRRAVEEAFPSANPADLFLDTPPQAPPPTPVNGPVNGAVSANHGINPKLLLDALTQPPSRLRKIALEAITPGSYISPQTSASSRPPASIPNSSALEPPASVDLPSDSESVADAVSHGVSNGISDSVPDGVSDAVSSGVSHNVLNPVSGGVSDGFSNAVPDGVSDTPTTTRAPSKADAVARARAALLDPAVIANWDKVMVCDWDPLPVSLVPVRGGFADRRGVVRSAQNPPKPHPLTSLSALYKDVVALFDPTGVDSLLDRRRDEGLIKRSELMELVKRLGEAGGSVKKPLAVFRWMQRQEQECLQPLESSYSVMVRLLGKLNAAEVAMGLIREMEGSGLERNVQTYNALMSGLAKRGNFEECWQLFQRMKTRGPVPETWTYNNLITAAALCLPGKEALKQGLLLLEEMQKEGLKPNVFTFNTLMQTGVKARDLLEVKRLFEEMRGRGCAPDLVSFNTIIKACLEKRDWEGLFEKVSAMQAAGCAPDATTYDSIISAYTQQGRFAEALSLLDEMREGGCRPDLRTYNSLLHACADAGDGDRGRALLRGMLRLEMKPTVFHWCSLMNAFAKAGRCDDAASVFRDMQAAKIAPTMYAYNILLDAYCRAGRFTTAEGLLRIMQKSPCKPNIVSYNTLIGAYARAKDLDQVKLVFKAMLKGGCGPNHQTQHIVSQAFEGAKRGREAMRLFWEAKQAAKRRKRAVLKTAQISDAEGIRDSLVER